ncbi:protein kinase family protein [Legionella fallonii]|uniref:Serine/threonine protein kinase n=1 Tax=Legionella fallonii LLAP-10 TaxID=1212491 RepID=A0A098G7I5_9GAMM|nr:protein kinase family protein [Legionella fallonii]CEG57929.1 Serine/threonine protein kinase [Legionella fallonii LLAP-10]
MTNPVRIINPTLPENIPIVIALAKSILGNNPGLLEHYTVYSLGENTSYALTLPVLQFIADPTVNSNVPAVRLDIFEPSSENNGNFGKVYPVIKSIIPHNDNGVFDDSGSYVVKEMTANESAPSDKPNKPNWFVRVANKEQYLGGQHPTLGIHYTLVKREKTSFLHMNRAPGLSLEHYRNKLSGEQFLSLVCTLIEEVPQQIHRIIDAGKHKGRMMIHCDLKPENIMAAYVNGQWTVTVIDMGLTKAIEKDSHYSTLQPYGNKLVWDGEMLLADMNEEPKIYDIQSDLYALFICICELAGAPSRDELTDDEVLNDIENPDLTGIFSTMNFDLNMKNQLEQAIRGALRANKMQRTPHNEVLVVFQKALAEVRKNKLMPQMTTPNTNTIQVTAEGLKVWVEQPLDQMILVEENKGRDRKITLKSWLGQFRKLCSLASAEESKRFNTWCSSSVNFRFQSIFIFNLLRFNLLNEYNDEACVRLLLRHEQLIAPLKTEQFLPDLWQKRFQMLTHSMSLQLTTTQADQCAELGLLKRNISHFLKQKIHEKSLKLFHVMQQQLAEQLKLDYKDWVEQLPEFAKLFNRQYQCVVKTEELRKKITPIFSSQNDLKQQFQKWGLTIFNNAEEGNFPEKIDEYFTHYSFLFELLTHFDTQRQVIMPLFDLVPELNQSPINWQSIEESIKKLQLADLQMVTALSQKLELLLLIHDVYACLINQSDVIIEANKTKFATLIKHVVDQTLPEKELKTKFEEMNDYFEDLDELGSFMDQCDKPYPNIQEAIGILLNNNYKIVELADAIRAKNQDFLLIRLDRGLKVILSEGENSSALNERIFTEMSRFFAIPLRYIPPTPKVHSQGNFNSMFLLLPNTEKDEITTPFHFRF